MRLRRLILVMGAVLLIVGVIALLVPCRCRTATARSVGCGNAGAEDLSGARSANDSGVAGVPVLNQIVPHTDLVALCDSAVFSRRNMVDPAGSVGAVAAVGAVLMRPKSAGGVASLGGGKVHDQTTLGFRPR